jgi:hypothetical protein
MITSGFYKLNEDGKIAYAPNYVYGAGVELLRGAKDSYVYPKDGWRWFDAEELAESFFGVEYDPPEQSPPPQTFENWDMFNAMMLQDRGFQQYTGACLQAAPAIALSLPAALAQIADKGINSFALVYGAFVQIVNPQQTDRDRWKGYAEASNLSIAFIDLI